MKTAEELYEALRQDYEAASGLTLNAGGDMALRLQAAAAQLESLWLEADFTARQSFPQTASGDWLDYHAQVRALRRAGATRAAGTLRFSLAAAAGYDIPVAAGTVCQTAAGIAFSTDAAGVIPAGALSCDVAARAAEAGTAGNVPAGSVVLMPHPPVGVAACTNPAAFAGGAAEEDDESLRARVLQSYSLLPNGANAAYYEARARDTEGVAAVSVLPRRRGLGTVDVVLAAAGGAPPQALLDTVQARLDADREICVDIDVLAPTEIPVDVRAAVKPATGQTLESVRAAAEAAVSALFTGARLGRSVLRAELISALFAVSGVRNCALSAPAADVTGAADALPVLGTLTLEEMD